MSNSEIVIEIVEIINKGDIIAFREFLNKFLRTNNINSLILNDGSTLLHIAAYLGQVEIINEILRHNPNINVTNNQNQTALHVTGSYTITQTLINHGADTKIKSGGERPIDTAYREGHFNAVSAFYN